eukprot:Awhi_evm1s2611
MLTPHPGRNLGLRITMKRAFGVFVRRFGILFKPLAFNVEKVPTFLIKSNLFQETWASHRLVNDLWRTLDVGGAPNGSSDVRSDISAELQALEYCTLVTTIHLEGENES